MHLVFQQKNNYGNEKAEFKINLGTSDNNVVDTELVMLEVLKNDEYKTSINEYLKLAEQEFIINKKRKEILTELKYKFTNEYLPIAQEQHPEWFI